MKLLFICLSLYGFAFSQSGFELSDFEKGKISIIKKDPLFFSIKRLVEQTDILYTKKSKIPVSLVTIDVADDLVELFNRYAPGFGDDGFCYARTYFFHLILRELKIKGASSIINKVSRWLRPNLQEDTRGGLIDNNGVLLNPVWRYHIAPIICTEGKKGKCVQLLSLDNSISSRAVNLNDWKKRVKGTTRLAKLDIVPPGIIAHNYSKKDIKKIRWWDGPSLQIVRDVIELKNNSTLKLVWHY